MTSLPQKKKGVIICAGCILTNNISIGDHVVINLDCTIGHNASLKSEKLIQNYTWDSYLNGVFYTFEEVLEDANRLI